MDLRIKALKTKALTGRPLSRQVLDGQRITLLVFRLLVTGRSYWRQVTLREPLLYSPRTGSRRVRLIKFVVRNTGFGLAATLFDKQRKPVGEFQVPDKRIKGRELSAASEPFAISRLLANRRDAERGSGDRTGTRVHSGEGNQLVGLEIEAMLLGHRAFVAESAAHTATSLFRCRRRERPGWSSREYRSSRGARG